MMLIETINRLDQLFDTPLPYMMWINQQPTNSSVNDAWMSIEIVSPWRQKGLARFIAAAEVGVGLAMVLLMYRNRRSIDLDELSEMKG